MTCLNCGEHVPTGRAFAILEVDIKGQEVDAKLINRVGVICFDRETCDKRMAQKTGLEGWEFTELVNGRSLQDVRA